MLENLKYLGNQQLFNLHKIAFLCSRQIPAAAVLKCYDWAIQMRNERRCVISGFHSPLEKDVLSILLKGNQPIIIVLAKGLPKKIPEQFKKAIEEKKLLLISNFHDKVGRASGKTATIRNKLMLEFADEIVVGFCSEKGSLKQLLINSKKPIKYLTSL